MSRTSWIHRIRNFDKLKQAFDNLKKTYDDAKDANTRKKTQTVQLNKSIERLSTEIKNLNTEIKDLRITNSKLLDHNGFLLSKLYDYMKEPERKGTCVKPRIDTEEAAKIIRDMVAISLGKPMWFYHCRTCPPSPLSKQRYYHLTSKEQVD